MSFYLSNEIKEKISHGEIIYAQAQQDGAPQFVSEEDVEIAFHSSTFAGPAPLVKLTPDITEYDEPSCLLFDIDLEGFLFVLCFMSLMAALCGWLDKWLSGVNNELVVVTNQASGAFDSLHAVLESEVALAETRQSDQGQGHDREQPLTDQNEDEEDGAQAVDSVAEPISEGVETEVGAAGGESRPKSRSIAQASKSAKEFDMPSSFGEAGSMMKDKKLTDTF